MDLNTSFEYRLLQGLGSGVVGRLARYNRERRTLSPASPPPDNNLAFLETELRLVLKWDVAPRLPEDTYNKLQSKLQKLCRVLEDAVNLSLALGQKAAPPNPTENPQVAQQAEGIDAPPPPARLYPNLRTLLGYLNEFSDTADTFDLDLANGPNPKLFNFQPGPQAKIALDAVHDCNESLVRLCKNNHNPSQRDIFPPVQTTASNDVRFQERTKEVLEALFRLFSSCMTAHEILLYLSDDVEGGQYKPTLDMFLSCCSPPSRWQETKCLPYDNRFTVHEIQDICTGLRTWREGTLFQILHEHQGIFNALDDIAPKSQLSVTPAQSLDHLIQSGAFLRNHRDRSRPLHFFDPKKKQSLALKLAHCLMYFADFESASPSWDSEKVFLLSPQWAKSHDRLLYVAFKSGNVYSPDTTIGFADPVMLAFAKLLLEIDLGKKIKLDESMSRAGQWGTLCEYAFEAERSGSGRYADAIYGCLFLHKYLRPGDDDQEVALGTVIYQRVVSQIEAALPLTSTGRKRRQSEASQDPILPCTYSAQGDTRLPYLYKRQRVDLTEEGRHNELQEQRQRPASNEPPAGRSKSGRVTVFRARNVPLHEQTPISEVITDIILKKVGDIDRTSIKFTIKDITRLAVKNSPYKTGKRGTALIIFRDPVPEPFQAVMRSSDSEVLVGDSDDEESSMDVDTKFIGATQLYEPPSEDNIVADIVAIHGLNGHPYGSWLSKSAKPQMWLKDFLPADVPNCRIFIYGYKSNIFDEKTHPRHELFSQAERLNATLNNIRTAAESKRPIIFLAHSYGGLVLARTLIEARARQRPLLEATAGLLLFACPNRGFHVQDILDAMRAEQEAAGEEPITDDKAEALVQRLGEGDFRNELAPFPDVMKGKQVYTFIETRKTETVTRKSGKVRRDGDPVMAAGPNSAILGLPGENEEVIPTDKDHSDIVKFASRGDETYEDIKCRIQALVEKATREQGSEERKNRIIFDEFDF